MYFILFAMSVVLIPFLGLAIGGIEGCILGSIISIVLISQSLRIVAPMTVYTVELMGKYNRILRPGLNFIIPILETTVFQDLQRKSYTSEVQSISSDKVSVWIAINIVYFVQDDGDDTRDGNIYKSVYITRNFTQILGATIDEQLRAMISTFSHKEIFAKRSEIEHILSSYLEERLAIFGYTLDSIQVTNIQLEESVMRALEMTVMESQLYELTHCLTKIQKDRIPLSPEIRELMQDILKTQADTYSSTPPVSAHKIRI